LALYAAIETLCSLALSPVKLPLVFPQSRFVDMNDIDMGVQEEGAGPDVTLIRGFPELAFSWRHQLPGPAFLGIARQHIERIRPRVTDLEIRVLEKAGTAANRRNPTK
jgi:hypothetical protein